MHHRDGAAGDVPDRGDWTFDGRSFWCLRPVLVIDIILRIHWCVISIEHRSSILLVSLVFCHAASTAALSCEEASHSRALLRWRSWRGIWRPDIGSWSLSCLRYFVSIDVLSLTHSTLGILLVALKAINVVDAGDCLLFDFKRTLSFIIDLLLLKHRLLPIH